MFRTKAQFLTFAGLAALAGCGGHPSAPPAPNPQAVPAEDLYLAPPSVSRAVRQGEAVVLSGQASPAAKLRLATPGGEVLAASADRQGRWTIALPASAQARIFGLSMAVGARQVQAQGYVLVAPGGQSALLRAGAGALRLDPRPAGRIGAFDFDREGGAVVSGAAPAGAALSVQLDGRQAADARADAQGRYSVALPRLAPGPHRLEVKGDGFYDAVAVEASPPAPLADGPLRSQFSPGGLRADWMTPGGGVQSTFLAG
ncbi:hypothetical protein DJ021_15150 [Phenylobacterium hankyongense]|uniref:Carboxypeptidase regulatory-like domain-containing protein n=1 Tax=Phenylobacterium hankyongense TaxID=1813876 RepID=A0A328B0U6_9CAUL|nr:hypothetical protein [Phenylobacterium hankyongense]RAK61052.1 hypothetical protein DJ021_15150 [Phenylobacterium hankyongense]